MWFLGMLAGLVVGGMLGGFGSAVGGAVLGGIGGAILRSLMDSGGVGGNSDARLLELERKVDHIYKSLEDIHWRLRKLEDPSAVHNVPIAVESAAPATTSPAAAAVEPHPAAAEIIVPALGMPTDPLELNLPPVTAAPAAAVQEPAVSKTVTPPQMPQTPVEARVEASAPAADEVETDEIAEPSLWQRLLTGNIVAKVGAVILFFGVAALLTYAYDNDVLPVPLRLAGVALVGIAMLVLGWRLMERRRLYSLILQGTGVGVLYLDVFFALRVFALIHPAVGFGLFVLLGIAATLLAVRQDSKVLAVLGLTGAFLAPILASSGSGQHVVLFSYYTLLNGFILVISWFKAWRDLNLTGFIFTFLVGVFWGHANYQPELFATVEPFVLIFFAMYLVIPILFAQRQPPELRGLVDGTLVFGTPLSVAFMQAGLVRDMPYGLAWSAGLGAALYALLAVMVLRREPMRLLGEAYVALSVVLGTMAIFFALDAYPTFALWTLEGAAIVWIGLRQRRLLARIFGIALQFAGAFLFLLHYADYNRASPWFNDFLLGCALIATAGAITSWLMHKHREVLIEGGERAAVVLLLWAFGWWFAGGLHALHDGMSPHRFNDAALIFAGASFALAEFVGGWIAWPSLRLITRLHLIAIVLGLVGIVGRHPLADLGAVAWPLNFAVFFWCLHWQAHDGIATVHGARYRAGWLLLAVLATWEALWLFGHRYFGWSMAMGALGMVAAWLRFHLRERDNVAAAAISQRALLWGLGFWLASGLGYIDWRVDSDLHISYALLFIAGSCTLFEIFGGWLDWAALRRTQGLLLPVMLLALFMQYCEHAHPTADGGLEAWIAAFAALYFSLERQRVAGIALAAGVQHVLAVWLGIGVVAWELAWQCVMHYPGSSWANLAWAAVPALALWGLTRHAAKLAPWRDDYASFRIACLGPVAAYGLLWSLLSSWDSSRGAPLPYLPLLNPVDLGQIALLFALETWRRAGDASDDINRAFAKLLAALGFLWLNCILLRTIHHWAGVPYEMDDMYRSILVQSALSLTWTLTALVLMLQATRRSQRTPWLCGAALLAVVVGKLFLLDLANSGTIEQIVSFLGVGALLMVIGYVAPVPPGDAESRAG